MMMVFVIGCVVLILFILCFVVIWYRLVPSAPQRLHGDWNDNRVVLIWTAVENADEYEVFYRRRESMGEAIWSSRSGLKSTRTEIDVITGVNYEVYVRAKNWAGSSRRSSVVFGCARATAPTQFTAVCDATKPLISLTWSKVSYSNGYIIKRRAMNDSEFHAIATVNSSSILQTQDTLVTYGVSYTYMVFSRDRVGESASSQPMIVCPRVPSPSHFIAITPTNQSATILLNWQPVLESASYHIYRRRVDEPIIQNSAPLVVLLNPNATSYLDQNVINTVKYSYTIASEDSAGVSSLSAAAIGVAALTAPKNLTAEPVHGNTAVILSWTGIKNVLGYRILRLKEQSSSEEEIGLLSHESNTKYVDTKAEHNNTYSYMVQAFDKTTKYGPKSNAVKITVLNVTPLSDRQKTNQEVTEKANINVRFGDLINEKVDAIVICLSSDELKKNVLKAAGHDDSFMSNNTHRHDVNGCFVASGGLLSCKNIIFVPCKGSAGSLTVLEQSVRTFVTNALQCAQQSQCKTISFPAVGCGGLGYDVATVAKTMISEAYKQLTPALWNHMHISFIMHRDKQNIYDEFFRQLQLQENQNISKTNQDSIIPSTWQLTNGAYDLRTSVTVDSHEGQLILVDFRRTMVNYNDQHIIRIQRIQNERWFRQYQIHKKDFDRRLQQDTEQRLYHGCADGEIAAKSIIEQGFNRSLAGTQHGTAFGLGVYFSSNASESHAYTKLSNGWPSGERYMFVCKVLVGKTTQGNSSMRTCPSGYDSTSNGSTIYVIYHDVQVYAEYLIVYK